MKNYKITLFGVKNTTKIIAEHLHNNGIKVDLIISIDKSVLKTTLIADYMDLKNTAKAIGAEYYCVNDYTLKQLDDHFFQNNEFQLGIVYGWQRLIPESIINQFSQGLFGFHASPYLLPRGKGRSPLNWSIILGKTVLYNHLFKYSSAADSGDIYEVTEFAITPHDTILTLLYKSLIIAKKELLKLIHDANNASITLFPQQGESSFFPKRSPKDGLIHFETQTTEEIINLIRGVTKPFSGAFCFTTQGKKILIWEAWEFDNLLDFSHFNAGEIIDNLYAMPIIKTIDGSIILRNYEGAVLLPNDKLVSEEA